MKYAAMNINFDSMSQMYGFPAGYRDPSYREIAKRFFKLSDKYNFKYTIFVIGKDLEDPEYRECVREWAQRGHEIGNHTWSHPLNLGALKPVEIHAEIARAHEIISKTVGREPKGFVAPAWSTSREVVSTLKELHYNYDSSAFPSWLLLPLMGKLMMHHAGGREFFTVFQRKDFPRALWAPRHPYHDNGLLIFPLPTNRYRVACWHTMAFVLGEKKQQALLRSCLKEEASFYYLMHPGDLLDARDLDPKFRLRMERMRPGLDEKYRILESCMNTIVQSGRSLVTMETLAKHVSEADVPS